jgi:hypothetical protein
MMVNKMDVIMAGGIVVNIIMALVNEEYHAVFGWFCSLAILTREYL